jgi:hypothetical protein
MREVRAFVCNNQKAVTLSRKTKTEEVQSETPAPPKPIGPIKTAVTWQRITVAMLGIGIEVGIWQWATWHLYSLPSEAISSFTTITVNCFYVIASLVIFFVTGKLIYDLKVDTVAQVVTKGEQIFEKKESHEVIENITVDETANNENLKEHRDEE